MFPRDAGQAVRLNDEFISADSKIVRKDSDRPVTEKFSLSWTESKTLTWQKTFGNTEKIGVSVGYRAGGSGGFEAMGEFEAQFSTTYQNGTAEVTSKTLTYDSSVEVPPHTHHEIYAEKTKTAYRKPYSLEGYVLNSDRSKTYKKIHDNCLFTYVSNVTVKHKNLNGDRKPVTLDVLKRKNPFGK